MAFTTHPTPGLRCGYHEGMFSNGARDGAGLRRYLEEVSALKFHEAGHAVLAYVLGLGLTELVLSEDVIVDHGIVGYAHHGVCTTAATGEINRLIRQGVLNERVLNHAVYLAAGPAAERKHNIVEKMPPHQLRVSEGDHQAISAIRKSLCYRLDSCFDIDEEAWRRAQDALEIDVIWSAVNRLAGELEMPWHDDEPGKYSEVYPGASVGARLRQWGIRPDILANVWPPFETRKVEKPRLMSAAMQP
jgi:hypothetical protein